VPFLPNAPDAATAGLASTAELDSLDFEVLLDGIRGDGVVSGCAVTAQGTPDMTVAVADGSVTVAGTPATVTAGNVTISPSNATLPRFDLVTVALGGVKTVIQGTAARNPVYPPLPATSVLLAVVLVPALSTTVTAARIVDKRVTVASGGGGGDTAEFLGFALSDETTALVAGRALTVRMPFAMTVTAVRASLTTASSSGVVTVDINENGTSILGTKLSIDATETTSATAAAAATITDASLADNAEITFDIDAAGTDAAGLKVWLIGVRV
jgi:hypothetical protein